MTIGIALSNVKRLLPTSPTIIDVVVEDDWSIDVAKSPIIKPASGLVSGPKIDSTNPSPPSEKVFPKSVIARTNKYNSPIMATSLSKIFNRGVELLRLSSRPFGELFILTSVRPLQVLVGGQYTGGNRPVNRNGLLFASWCQ